MALRSLLLLCWALAAAGGERNGPRATCAVERSLFRYDFVTHSHSYPPSCVPCAVSIPHPGCSSLDGPYCPLVNRKILPAYARRLRADVGGSATRGASAAPSTSAAAVLQTLARALQATLGSVADADGPIDSSILGALQGLVHAKGAEAVADAARNGKLSARKSKIYDPVTGREEDAMIVEMATGGGSDIQAFLDSAEGADGSAGAAEGADAGADAGAGGGGRSESHNVGGSSFTTTVTGTTGTAPSLGDVVEIGNVRVLVRWSTATDGRSTMTLDWEEGQAPASNVLLAIDHNALEAAVIHVAHARLKRTGGNAQVVDSEMKHKIQTAVRQFLQKARQQADVGERARTAAAAAAEHRLLAAAEEEAQRQQERRNIARRAELEEARRELIRKQKQPLDQQQQQQQQVVEEAEGEEEDSAPAHRSRPTRTPQQQRQRQP
jgi:hypothetical protein